MPKYQHFLTLLTKQVNDLFTQKKIPIPKIRNEGWGLERGKLKIVNKTTTPNCLKPYLRYCWTVKYTIPVAKQDSSPELMLVNQTKK